MYAKIGKEVAHVTHDSDTTFKVKQAVLLTAVLARQAAAAVGVRTCWPWETAATLPSARRRKALRHQRGRRGAGAYRGGLPPTACIELVQLLTLQLYFLLNLFIKMTTKMQLMVAISYKMLLSMCC